MFVYECVSIYVCNMLLIPRASGTPIRYVNIPTLPYEEPAYICVCVSVFVCVCATYLSCPKRQGSRCVL